MRVLRLKCAIGNSPNRRQPLGVQLYRYGAPDPAAHIPPGLPAHPALKITRAGMHVRLHLKTATDPTNRDVQKKTSNPLPQMNRPLQPRQQLPAL